MAPFNTHFLIAEKIWPELPEACWPHYGQFCFGCLAPDVDKVSAVLTQKDTHFFDRTDDYKLMASHRTAAFLEQQVGFLQKPFLELSAPAQAFALGYLCHLCVDEVSKYMWQRSTWVQFKGVTPGPAFAALDEAARRLIRNYSIIVQALDSVEILNVIPRIPPADLATLLAGVRNFVDAGTIQGEYLALIDMFDQPSPAERERRLEKFNGTIDAARQQVHLFKPATLIAASLTRSRQRLADLIQGRVPVPDAPTLQ